MIDKRMKELRQKADLSLGEAARRIGISLGDYSKIERGAMLPVGDLIGKMASALGCTDSDIRAALPTAEEVEEEQRQWEEVHGKFLKGFAAARADANAKGLKRGNGGRGQIPCPCCNGGTLHYSVANYNGHMWGSCSNKECVRWMQ